MTSRQRVLTAISHRSPDRIPCTLYTDDDLRTRLESEAHQDLLNRIAQFDSDTVRILWDIEHRRVDARTFYDSFGVRWAVRAVI